MNPLRIASSKSETRFVMRNMISSQYSSLRRKTEKSLLRETSCFERRSIYTSFLVGCIETQTFGGRYISEWVLQYVLSLDKVVSANDRSLQHVFLIIVGWPPSELQMMRNYVVSTCIYSLDFFILFTFSWFLLVYPSNKSDCLLVQNRAFMTLPSLKQSPSDEWTNWGPVNARNLPRTCIVGRAGTVFGHAISDTFFIFLNVVSIDLLKKSLTCF